MEHRHLTHSNYSLPAIDDIISRGGWSDWVELQRECVRNPSLKEKVRKVCKAHIADPYAQRYHFWWKNVQ